MKLKFILSLALLGSTAFAGYADGYKDGVEYYQAGQEKNAETVLTKTINDAQTDKAEAYYYLGCIALNKGNKEQAAKYFDQGLQANPEYAYNYIGKGAILLKDGNKKEAEKLFKEAEKKDKKDAKIKVDIARAYYNADKDLYMKEWEKAMKDARKKDKTDPYSYIFQGDVYADLKDYGNAAGYYEMAIGFDPELPFAYVKYANTYFHINPKIAIQKLEEIVAQNPNSALAQRELAEKYYEDNQWTNAANQYKNVINNPNRFPSDEERYVVLLYFDKNYTESLNRAQTLLQENPSSFLMKRMLFLNAAAMENYADAEKHALDFFASGSKENIYTSNDYTTYGDVLEKLGKEEESLASYEKAAAINPDKTELLKELSSAYSTAGSAANAANDTVKTAEYYQKAALYFQQFIDKTPEHSTNDEFLLAGYYQNVIATALDDAAKNDAYEKAIAIVDKVASVAVDNYRIPQRKARIQMAMEGNDRQKGLAVDAYKEMMEVVKNSTSMEEADKNKAYMEAYMYIAAYYLANNDSATAKQYYEMYLELDPTNEALRQYIQNMK